jgi:NAD(P)-dependent dehydrogenase (short-subunit alcohol dehydrogenase family)
MAKQESIAPYKQRRILLRGTGFAKNESRADRPSPEASPAPRLPGCVIGPADDRHTHMTGRVVTGFGFSSTADEVLADVDLAGRRAIVTGGASGIGAETARALAAVGAEITIAVRRPAAAEPIAAQIRSSTGNPLVRVRELDLADLDSVRDFTAEWKEPLHILVNNAGIMAVPDLQRSANGQEIQFSTNFLGHFMLTTGLHNALAAANGARVVCLSSSGHMMSPVIVDDLNYNFRPYDPWTAYGQSKTADILMAVEVNRRWWVEGINANALNPGAISTNLQRYTGGLVTPVEKRKSVQQGAATSVLLAASPVLDGIGGRYFEDCNEAPLVTRRPSDFSGGVAPYALNPATAERLWTIAAELI